MPPHAPLAKPLRTWRCPQCARRAFSTTRSTRAVGPEHPKYIDVPEAPQQSGQDYPPVKGTLPVPRDVLARNVPVRDGKKIKGSKAWLETTMPVPQKKVHYAEGSRDEWKVKITDARRRNLREGLQSLKARQQSEEERETAYRRDRAEKQRIAFNAPEREDERLTMPTHGLDLDALFNHAPQDPHREARLATKRANVAQHAALRSNARLNNLHTLYMNARTFIVTPQQLDEAVDEAFGTEEKPANYGVDGTQFASSQSVWAQGKPASVQDMLVASQGAGRGAVKIKGGIEASRERMRRIAEELTGGAMEGEGANGQ